MSNVRPPRARWALIAYFGIAAIAIGVGTVMLTPEYDLPIYQPSDLNPALVDAAVQGFEDHRILPFELVNQLGDTVRMEDVAGQVLVVDFFFTRCRTICPMLTDNMKRVQDQVLDDDRVRLMSHSVTPVADSVPVLLEYAATKGVDPDRWWLLTGAKSEVYKLARKSYFAALDEGDGGFQDFVHTENMVLVDTLGRLRGFYDGTDLDEVNDLVRDLSFLLGP
ncbi:MAG: SCO family protein [Flavobacteriales bacterium]|nr:SCO family protein [Flavobacteriales bacterium]